MKPDQWSDNKYAAWILAKHAILGFVIIVSLGLVIRGLRWVLL